MHAKHSSSPPASSRRVRDTGEAVYEIPIKSLVDVAKAKSASTRACASFVHERGTWCSGCPTTRAATSRRTCLGIVRIRDTEGEVVLSLVAARRVDRNTVRVNVYRVDDDLVAGLRKAKVHQIADAAMLTAREREVLDLILLGRSPREIAAVLNISHSTAKFHQANTLEKLGAESRFDVLRLIS